MVHPSKPAHRGDTAFGYKTAGCKQETRHGKRLGFTRLARGNVGTGTVTGGADVHETNVRLCMRKGSACVRASQARAIAQYSVAKGL